MMTNEDLKKLNGYLYDYHECPRCGQWFKVVRNVVGDPIALVPCEESEVER